MRINFSLATKSPSFTSSTHRFSSDTESGCGKEFLPATNDVKQNILLKNARNVSTTIAVHLMLYFDLILQKIDVSLGNDDFL